MKKSGDMVAVLEWRMHNMGTSAHLQMSVGEQLGVDWLIEVCVTVLERWLSA